MFAIALFIFIFYFCCCIVAEPTSNSTSITPTSADETLNNSFNHPISLENKTSPINKNTKPLELSTDTSVKVSYQQICKLKLPQLRAIARLLKIDVEQDKRSILLKLVWERLKTTQFNRSQLLLATTI